MLREASAAIINVCNGEPEIGQYIIWLLHWTRETGHGGDLAEYCFRRRGLGNS